MDEARNGDPSQGPEIFIGLIGAVGTDLYRIREQLKQELRRANYIPEIIHLSKLMMDLKNLERKLRTTTVKGVSPDGKMSRRAYGKTVSASCTVFRVRGLL